MADSQKIVHVPDVGVIAFPGDLEDEHVKRLIKSFRAKKTKTTEESEKARQLKPAQPLSSAIPSLPDWANKPLVSDKDLEETPQGQALTAKSQAQFSAAHPKVEAALEKGNTPAVLGTLQGANEFTKGMQTPANMALMLGAPESKILSGIFATQAMRGSFRDAKAAKTAFDAGNNEEAMKYVTQALLGAGIAGLAGSHAYTGLPEGVRTKLGSEEGSVPVTPEPFSYGHTPERRSQARQIADIQAKKAEFDRDLADAEAKLAKHGNKAVVGNSPEYEEDVRNVMNVRDKQRSAQAMLDRLKAGTVAPSIAEVKAKAEALKNPSGIEMARTAEGKLKLGADPAALGKILGSSLYKENSAQVITKELVQNAMDVVRGITGDNNVKVELFDKSYPMKPSGEVVGSPGNLGFYAIKNPDGSYVMDENAPPGQRRIKTWRYEYDAQNRLDKLYPRNTSGDTAIRITDSGKGMTKNELETVFTDLGSSGKREQAEASGGFGLAKAAPLMMSDRLEVSTVVNEDGKLMRHSFSATPQDLLGEGVDIKSEVLPPGSAKTGTTVLSILPKEANLYGARSFLGSTRLSLRPPGKLNAFYNGKDLSGIGPKPMQNVPIATLDIPGAKLDLYTSHDKNEAPSGKYGGLSTEVHNNGIFQFTRHANMPEGIRGIPTRLAVDVRATVPEGHPDYPFMANREALRGDIDKAIDELVKEKVTKALIDAHKKQISEMYWKFPMLDGYIPVFDSGGRLKPEELKELMENPALKEISNSIMDLAAEARNLLVKAAENNYALGQMGEKTKRIGIVFSDAIHGVHITNPEDPDHATVFINPFDSHQDSSPFEYASLMWHTIKHELVHDEVSGHSESFTTGEKNVSRAVGSMEIKALTELRDKYADPRDSTQIRPDFNRALQIYRESRGRPESTPDIFRGEESRANMDRPTGEKDDPDRLRSGGKGTVSTLDEVKQRADELQKKFQKAGLAQ